MYIRAGIDSFMRHGARGVSDVGSSVGPASMPVTSLGASQIQLPTSSKSLIGVGVVVGATLLGSYACTAPAIGFH